MNFFFKGIGVVVFDDLLFFGYGVVNIVRRVCMIYCIVKMYMKVDLYFIMNNFVNYFFVVFEIEFG